ncbi:TPA: hypothetical protein ACM2WJ_002061 [Klebsiella pneumoniae]|uniref:hypothetical protein n=1 Tax=Klebsiella pneumoniae TaxID=573 RepID=UPI000A268144|nr:hypothetical protein [Klebsiella pneumoniae]MBX4517583.1 hypothetical protein [Klebsiella pneumoniae]MCA5497515.1 hypothetical protein [Klebsiella pneumoniae]MCA5508262.1 hypothetical protein [Klebsiella pneumoniae]MCI8186536.1 hypothetical protein [Klebsiella pneumoniae]MCQ0510519.1 hypothetical protein [Klebsiella pneumoniae]
MNKDIYHARWRLHHAKADLNYHLECFGDHLSEKEGYPSDIYGFDAIYLYLSQKLSCTINQCREMTMDDLRLSLSVEMKDWRVPADAIHAATPRENNDC